MQRAVRVRIEAVAGRPPRATGTDGCGVPTFAFTLIEAATVFSRLPAQTPRALDAMRAHPFLVAGSHRICTSVMSGAKGVVMKVGAEGLMCGALADRRLAFALKTRDGSGRGREIATLRILELLGVLRDDLSRSVLQDIEPLIRTGQGRQPNLRCIGDLEQA